MVALIDGDIIAYRSAAAAQKTRYKVVDNVTEDVLYEGPRKREADVFVSDTASLNIIVDVEPAGIAAYYAKKTIDDMLARLETSEFKVYLSGADNFRKKINRVTKYKGNRDRTEKPIHLQAVRDYLVVNYGADIINGMEADDAIGIDATKLDDAIVCSLDKDLDQIPGWHYNWVKDVTYPVTPQDAEYQFYSQMLMGDPSDNVLGIPGVGEVKAGKILMANEIADWPKVVADEYYRFYGTGEGKTVCDQLGLTWKDVLKDHEMLIRIRTEAFDEESGFLSVFDFVDNPTHG